MTRNELKQMWFNLPTSDVVTKTILVKMDKYPSRKGQGIVQVTYDGPEGYSSMSTQQVNPVKYALNKMKDKCNNRLKYNDRYDYSTYQLVIK
mgnify:CR=1 FL=1